MLNLADDSRMDLGSPDPILLKATTGLCLSAGNKMEVGGHVQMKQCDQWAEGRVWQHNRSRDRSRQWEDSAWMLQWAMTRTWFISLNATLLTQIRCGGTTRN